MGFSGEYTSCRVKAMTKGNNPPKFTPGCPHKSQIETIFLNSMFGSWLEVNHMGTVHSTSWPNDNFVSTDGVVRRHGHSWMNDGLHGSAFPFNSVCEAGNHETERDVQPSSHSQASGSALAKLSGTLLSSKPKEPHQVPIACASQKHLMRWQHLPGPPQSPGLHVASLWSSTSLTPSPSP